jgi:hypothetical protein
MAKIKGTAQAIAKTEPDQGEPTLSAAEAPEKASPPEPAVLVAVTEAVARDAELLAAALIAEADALSEVAENGGSRVRVALRASNCDEAAADPVAQTLV